MEPVRSIPHWPKEERPRERLLTQGAGVLSDTELIAILLGHGTKGQSAVSLARSLLQNLGGIGALGKQSAIRLSALPGLGPAKAAKLLAACELGRRRERRDVSVRIALGSPAEAARLAATHLCDSDRECFLAFYLDIKNRLIKSEIISIGGLDQAAVYPRELFKLALELSAAGIILAHNHPSGDPTPSSADIHLTLQLHQAAKLFGIRLLDHVIIGNGSYKSLMAEGHLPDASVSSSAKCR